MSDRKIHIYGRNPIIENLRNNPDKIEKIFVKDSLYASFYKVRELSKTNRIPVSKVPQEKLTGLVGRVNDQGIVALMSSVEYVDLLDWLYETEIESNPCLIILDGIEDPHNFGAIIRTASAAGVNGILVPKQGQAPVSGIVHKTSAGTVGKIPIIRANTVANALNDLKAAGFIIIGLDGNAEKNIWEFEYNQPVAFVIGNEGYGIKKHHLKLIDETLSMPMSNDVESLNASVSTGILIYEWKKNHL